MKTENIWRATIMQLLMFFTPTTAWAAIVTDDKFTGCAFSGKLLTTGSVDTANCGGILDRIWKKMCIFAFRTQRVY